MYSTSITTANHYPVTSYNNSESADRSMPTVLIRNTFEVWSADADDAKMLLDIPFPMNQVITDRLTFNLVDICLDNTPQILCNLLLCF